MVPLKAPALVPGRTGHTVGTPGGGHFGRSSRAGHGGHTRQLASVKGAPSCPPWGSLSVGLHGRATATWRGWTAFTAHTRMRPPPSCDWATRQLPSVTPAHPSAVTSSPGPGPSERSAPSCPCLAQRSRFSQAPRRPHLTMRGLWPLFHPAQPAGSGHR